MTTDGDQSSEQSPEPPSENEGAGQPEADASGAENGDAVEPMAPAADDMAAQVADSEPEMTNITLGQDRTESVTMEELIESAEQPTESESREPSDDAGPDNAGSNAD